MGAYDCDCINNLEYDRRERKAQLSQEGTTSDTISRQEVIDLLKQMRKDGDMVPWEGKNVFARIRKLPTVQPKRKKGKWIYNSPVTMKCDQCGLVIKDWDWHRFKICPNCGADMRGEQHETD